MYDEVDVLFDRTGQIGKYYYVFRYDTINTTGGSISLGCKGVQYLYASCMLIGIQL
mgnify:FL=1